MDHDEHDTPAAGTERRTVDEMAAAGDVRAMLADMRAHPHLYRADVAVPAMRRALAASAARGDFASHADDVFLLMTALTVDLLVVAQVPMIRRLDQVERDLTGGHESQAYRWVEQGLAVVERLHTHLVDLLKAQATVRHTATIGRGKGAAAAPDPHRRQPMRLVRDTGASTPLDPGAVPTPADAPARNRKAVGRG